MMDTKAVAEAIATDIMAKGVWDGFEERVPGSWGADIEVEYIPSRHERIINVIIPHLEAAVKGGGS